jgi:AcrR family transcriptional regulator
VVPPISLDKSQQILEIARQRFLHYGIAKTTMRDIANDLGISVSNLYLYFANKRDIVFAIAMECRQQQEQFLEGILQDSSHSPDEKLRTFLINKFCFIRSFCEESPHGKELLAFLVQEFPHMPEEWQERFEASIRLILSQGETQGVFHITDIPNAARLIRIATGLYYLPPYVILPSPPDQGELSDLIDWIIANLKKRESSNPS